MNLLLEEIWLETRKTIIFVTHNIGEAVFLSDRVFVMSSRPGRLAKIFDIDYERPRSLDITAERHFFDRVNEIKSEIVLGPGAGGEEEPSRPDVAEPRTAGQTNG